MALPLPLDFDLMCSNAKTTLKNDDGKTPLEVAELNEQEAVVEVLKRGKVKPTRANLPERKKK